jgi:hypothetical protein
MGRSGTGSEVGGEAERERRQRHHWTERHAREVIAELRASGEPVARFAQRKGITRQRLAYWSTRLRETVPVAATAAFVQVAPAPSGPMRGTPTSPPSLATTEPIAIRVGAAVIRVDASHDVEHVARLVDAVARRLVAAPC